MVKCFAAVPAAIAFLVVVFAAQDMTAQAATDIDRIEVVGNTILSGQDVEIAMELGSGDGLDRAKVVRTAENLKNLYRARGYEAAGIKSEMVRHRTAGKMVNILKFTVTEGYPARVVSFALVPIGFGFDSLKPKDAHESAYQEYWKANKASLHDVIRIKHGEVLDQEKIAQAKRALQDALALEAFVGARIEDVRVVQAPPPKDAASAALKTSRWVMLEFHVNLGDRLVFGFRGNKVIPRSRLSALIEEQRLTGFGKNYIGTIQARIEDEYRQSGYAWVRVTPYTYEKPRKQERHITFDIDEGPRVTIDSVDFDGNLVFGQEQLKKEFFSKAMTAVQSGYYISKNVDKTAELVVEWIKSQGYLSAKLVTIGKTFTGGRKEKVKLLVYIYEGEQTIVQSIRYSGITILTREEMGAMLGIRENEPLNLFAFSAGLETLKAFYRSRGHLEARIVNEGTDTVIRYSRENRFADIFIEVDAGAEYRVSRIEIEGLSATREFVARRELEMVEGEILEERLITESESNLRRLGIFSTVTIRHVDDPDKPGHKIVRVSIQEGTPGIIAGGLGYRNDLGVRGFGQAAYTDVGGRNHTLALNIAANKRINEDFCSNRAKRAGLAVLNGNEKREIIKSDPYCFFEFQTQLSYNWPWFIFDRTTFRPVLTLDKTQYDLFDAASVSFSATLERPVFRKINLVAALTYSIESITQMNAALPVDNQTLRIGSLTPSLKLDLRDNPLMPTSGFYSTASFELASPALGSRSEPYPIGYTRFLYRADGFIPLYAKKIIWYLSFRTGHEFNLEVPPPGTPKELLDRYQIPMIKQFALGGVGSLRGYTEQALNHQARAILGAACYVNYRTQIDFPFAGDMKIAPFLDVANLLEQQYKLFEDLLYTAGIGFHYRSPIGSVNFDWGFKLNKVERWKNVDPEGGSYKFHFSVGMF